MGIFGRLSKPNAQKMKAKGNVKGLINALRYGDILLDAAVRSAAKKALVEIGLPAVEPLIAALTHEDHDTRSSSLTALREIGEPAVEALLQALAAGKADVQDAIIGLLSEIRDPRAIKPLMAALDSREHDLRSRAAWALGTIKNPLATGALIFCLKDSNSEVREAAAVALGEIEDALAVEPLMAAVRDDISGAQCNGKALPALANMGDPCAIDIFAGALEDEDISRRVVAIKALDKIGRPAVKALIIGVANLRLEIRRDAATALSKITGEKYSEDHNNWMRWWEENGEDE